MEKPVKRLISCTANEITAMDKEMLIKAIQASEGRVIMAEVIAGAENTPINLTNAEIVRAFSADLILLNKLDVLEPKISALPETDEPIKLLKALCGRPLGVNLEPVDASAQTDRYRQPISAGRLATVENFKRCEEMGFDFVLLTGNPASGVTNHQIAQAITAAKAHFSGVVMAGKMHNAGVSEAPIDKATLEQFINNGADVILLPAAGTVPGVTIELLHQATQYVQSQGKLVISAIGTSQEASDVETIKQIALWNKMAGADIHHIGSTGYAGVAPYENIYHLSLAVRGLRHTVFMMANSLKR